MSTTVLLIRHGENDFAGNTLVSWRPGVHLNEMGREQAERLAERLAAAPIRAIYASPLERTQETAAPLAKRLGLPVQCCEAVGEIRFGDWTNRRIVDLEPDPLWRNYCARRATMHAPNGESALDVQLRMVDAFETFRRTHPDQMIAVFSHGDPIRTILAHVLGMHLDFMERIDVPTTGVSVIRLNEWGPVVLRMNCTGELP